MQSVCMRCVKCICGSPGGNPDRIHHQFVSLIMADGFAAPGSFQIGRVPGSEPDVAKLMVALIDNQHPVGCLNEIIGLNIAEQESGGPGWPAACAWAECFIYKRTLVVLPHAFPRPWQQNGTV